MKKVGAPGWDLKRKEKGLKARKKESNENMEKWG